MYARVTTFPGLAPARIKATPEEFTGHHLPRPSPESGERGVGRPWRICGRPATAARRVVPSAPALNSASPGWVAEWSNAHAWKACLPQGNQGSNPCPSALAGSFRLSLCAFSRSIPAMRHAFAVLLLLLVIPARAAGPGNAYFANLLEAARTDYATGHLDTALMKLDQRDQVKGASAEPVDLRALILLEQGKLDPAEQAVNEAHKLQPSLFAPRLHLGDILLRTKKYADARDVYAKLASETSVLISNERARYGLLLASLGLHDDPGAERALGNIKLPTETAAYYFAQAATDFAHGNVRSAKKWMATAHQIFEAASLFWFERPLYDLGWLKDKPPPPIL